MSYIISISNNFFYEKKDVEEITFTSNLEKACKFDKIGDAMREAAFLQSQCDNKRMKVISL